LREGALAVSLVWYAGAVVGGMLVSAFILVLQPVRLFAFDYFFSIVLIAGCVLMVRRPAITLSLANAAKALALAAYTIAVPGLLVLSHFTHVNLSPGRWWRMLLVAAALLPLSLSDEVYLRPIRPRWKAVAGIVLTRAMLTALVATGALTLNRSAAFLVLLVHLVAIFSVVLWFLAAGIRRHTQDAFATALFMALVQAWFLAATFVLI
jgi:hypothetical protein